jgi:FAD:protein FMN transferase
LWATSHRRGRSDTDGASGGTELSRVPRSGQHTTSPPYPFGSSRRHRRHRSDRCCRGEGASRCQFGGQFQGGTAGHFSDDILPHDDDPHDIDPDAGHFGGKFPAGNCSHHSGADHDNHQSTPHDHHDSSRGHLRWHVTLTATVTPSHPELVQRSFRAIGTTATVAVVDPSCLDSAESLLRHQVAAIDLACSRFRPDSELERLHSLAGSAVTVSPLLFEALEVAVDVAERTHGAVDPTVGNAVSALGYDRDFDQVRDQPSLPSKVLGPVVGYGHIHLDARTRTVRIPKGVLLDLGASAKALVADRSAARIADQLGTGVLVSLGGDVAVAGRPPPGGWAIGIAVESSAPARDVDQVVAIHEGGLASSSTAVRTWKVDTEVIHHVIDPSTGYSAAPYWTLVSVAGSSCVDANSLSTAAVVWGSEALDRLRPFARPVRLLRRDGEIFTLGGWPEGTAS